MCVSVCGWVGGKWEGYCRGDAQRPLAPPHGTRHQQAVDVVWFKRQGAQPPSRPSGTDPFPRKKPTHENQPRHPHRSSMLLQARQRLGLLGPCATGHDARGIPQADDTICETAGQQSLLQVWGERRGVYVDVPLLGCAAHPIRPAAGGMCNGMKGSMGGC